MAADRKVVGSGELMSFELVFLSIAVLHHGSLPEAVPASRL
jgi:hypothetical protein